MSMVPSPKIDLIQRKYLTRYTAVFTRDVKGPLTNIKRFLGSSAPLLCCVGVGVSAGTILCSADGHGVCVRRPGAMCFFVYKNSTEHGVPYVSHGYSTVTAGRRSSGARGENHGIRTTNIGLPLVRTPSKTSRFQSVTTVSGVRIIARTSAVMCLGVQN